MEWKHPSSGGRTTIKQCRTALAADDESDARLQVHVDPLLSQLGRVREAGGAAVDECYAIMGVTMVDLYSANSDLFVAGMAAGGSNVAVFSFARYHPCLKMSPEHLLLMPPGSQVR